jgi:hypothetical protein
LDNLSVVTLHRKIKNPADLTAICRERRAVCAPLKCDQGQICWVRDGAPAFGPAGPGGRCKGCGGKPFLLRNTTLPPIT